MKDTVDIKNENLEGVECTVGVRNVNFSVYGSKYSTPEVPAEELITNGMEHAIQTTVNEPQRIHFYDNIYEGDIRYIVCLNTGSHPMTEKESWEFVKKFFDLGRLKEDIGKTSFLKNSLCKVGAKVGLSYFTPYNENFTLSFLVGEDYFGVVKGPYTADMKIKFYSRNDWKYEGFSVALKVEVENKKQSFKPLKDDVRKKYAWELMTYPNLDFRYNGKKVSAFTHAPIVVKPKDIKDMLYDEVVAQKRNDVSIEVISKSCIKAVVDCPIINGKIEVIQMVADKSKGSSDSSGITLFNHGIRVEYPKFSIIMKKLRNQDGGICKNSSEIPDGRTEPNRYATYVNMLSNISMPFTDDKVHIIWDSDIGRNLRQFIDELVGEVYREAFRKDEEAEIRKIIDHYFETVCENSNFCYLKEAKIRVTGGKYKSIDGLIIKKNPRIKNGMKNYKLTKEDVLSCENKNEKFCDFTTIEYKSFLKGHKYSKSPDINHAIEYSELFVMYMGIEDVSRIPVILIGPELDEYGNDYLKMKQKNGHAISFLSFQEITR